MESLIKEFSKMRERFIDLIIEAVRNAGGSISLEHTEEYQELLDDGECSVIQKIKPLSIRIEDGGCIFWYMYQGERIGEDLIAFSMNELYQIAIRL